MQVFSKRNVTEAMLKVLQHEIRKTQAKSQRLEWVEELTLTETIGKGGFGVVYKGSWKGTTAAIKVWELVWPGIASCLGAPSPSRA